MHRDRERTGERKSTWRYNFQEFLEVNVLGEYPVEAQRTPARKPQPST